MTTNYDKVSPSGCVPSQFPPLHSRGRDSLHFRLDGHESDSGANLLEHPKLHGCGDLRASDKPSDNGPHVTAGIARRTQTPQCRRPAVIRRNPIASDETGMHGKEKVYGSIP